MGRQCDNEKGNLKWAHPFPRVLGYKRGSDIMKVMAYLQSLPKRDHTRSLVLHWEIFLSRHMLPCLVLEPNFEVSWALSLSLSQYPVFLIFLKFLGLPGWTYTSIYTPVEGLSSHSLPHFGETHEHTVIDSTYDVSKKGCLSPGSDRLFLC
jgi:hypothetical protein